MSRISLTRPAGGGGAEIHGELTGRDAADSHPMAAVTGLAAALGDKADAADLPALVTAGPVGLGAHGGAEGAYTWVEVPNVCARGLAFWLEVTSSDALNLFDVQIRSATGGGGVLSLEAIGITGQTYLVTAPVYLTGSVGGSVFVGIKNRHASGRTFTLTLLKVERFA